MIHGMASSVLKGTQCSISGFCGYVCVVLCVCVWLWLWLSQQQQQKPAPILTIPQHARGSH